MNRFTLFRRISMPALTTGTARRCGWPLAMISSFGAVLLAVLLLALGGEYSAQAARLAGIGAPGPADWTRTGEAFATSYGYSVSSAGDVNHDGYDDFLVGAHLKNRNNSNDPLNVAVGKAYLYAGGAGSLGAAPFATFEGENAGDQFGYQVSAAGDVNGDGIADFLISAPQADAGGGITDTGGVSIYLGRDGQPPILDKLITGEAAGDQFGWSASGAGDVNDDGFDDIIVGAWGHNQDTGKVYVYHGSAGGINPGAAFTAQGEQLLDGFGVAVAGAGDINGDGYDDVIAGAWQNDEGGLDVGKVYVYHGGSGGLSAAPAFTDVGTDVSSNFGGAVASAGDANGDGYDDVIVGANRNTEGGTYPGKAYLYLGSPAGLVKPAVAVLAGERAGDDFGASVSAAGDVNGDGFADLLAGAHRYDLDAGNPNSEAGRAYLYAGCVDGIQATPIFSATGATNNSHLGRSVSAAGDVNGDGYGDVGAGGYGMLGNASVYHGENSVGVCSAKIEVAQTVSIEGYGPACGTATNLKVPRGSTVAYCYTVKNAGTAPLRRHALLDTQFGQLLDDFPHDLAPGASYSYVLTVTAEADRVTEATWTGRVPILAPDGSPAIPVARELTATATATATVLVQVSLDSDDTDGDGVPDNIEGTEDGNHNDIPAFLDPEEQGGIHVSLVQTVGIDGAQPDCANTSLEAPSGSTVAFCYTVTNIGRAPLHQHSLTSSGFGPVLSALAKELAPGESYTYRVTAAVNQTMNNVATWTAAWAPPAPQPTISVSSTATATVIISDSGNESGLFFPLIAKP